MATQGAFKKLGAGAYRVYPYKVHKNWVLDESTVGIATSSMDPDIQIFTGDINNKVTQSGFFTEPYYSSSVSGDTIYRQIRHLYYGGAPHSDAAYATRSLLLSGSGIMAGYHGYDPTIPGNGVHVNEPYNSFGSNNTNEIYKDLHTGSLTWISIPHLVFGEGIERGTVVLTDKSTGTVMTIKDDSEGNLYDTGYSSSLASAGSSSISASYVGNIFYEHGNFVLIAPSRSLWYDTNVLNGVTESYNTGQYGQLCKGRTDADGFDLEFKGTITNYEQVIDCVAGEGEFNFSMNDSLRTKNSGSDKNEIYPGELIPMATSSTYQPYVTTLGLYDDQRRLLAVGKLARPIRKDPTLSISFMIRFDL